MMIDCNLHLQDYEMVLKLDPENLDAQNEIKKLNQVGSCFTTSCIFGVKG